MDKAVVEAQNTIKPLLVDFTPKSHNQKHVVTEKPKKQRVLTQTTKWAAISDQLVEHEACGLLTLLNDDNPSTEVSKLISQQVRSKISGYASQDKEKGMFLREHFIQFQQILDLFRETKMKCYYCKESTRLLYQHVREQSQWTLERLDNAFGHNHGNVVIACLKCNLRRRTMASERYVKTKEMSKIVKID
jgi:ATP-dependent Lon protease